MANSTLYMGVSITPDSEQRPETPGLWWPRATLRKAATGETLWVVTHPQHCASQEEADATALRMAKRHVREELHQG
jgi:hypothetical protein